MDTYTHTYKVSSRCDGLAHEKAGLLDELEQIERRQEAWEKERGEVREDMERVTQDKERLEEECIDLKSEKGENRKRIVNLEVTP
jgi:chromosome segregation ATPase